MIKTGKPGERAFGITYYYFCNFSTGLKLFQNQKLKNSLPISKGFVKTNQNRRSEGTLETSK